MLTKNSVEVVLITHAKDFSLARVMLRSIKLYCPLVTKIHVLVDRKDKDAWLPIAELPINLIAKEDIWPSDLPEVDGYKKQLILKFLSYKFVDSDFIWLLDSDMLLTAPLNSNDLGLDSRIKWYYSEWDQTSSIFRKNCEDFLGFSIPYLFMSNPLYIFRKDVLKDFLSKYDLSKMLPYQNISEFICYGAFAYNNYQNYYQFLPNSESAIAQCVNQVPPTYLVLDENVKWQDSLKTCSILAIWSHWHLALNKMIEFYHDSQIHHFGILKDKVLLTQEDYLLDKNEINLKYLKGLYTDSWVEQQCTLTLPAAFANQNLNFKFELPFSNTSVTCEITMPDNTQQTFTLSNRKNIIEFLLPDSRSNLTIRMNFSGGKSSQNKNDARHFYAKLNKIEVGNSSIKNQLSLKNKLTKLISKFRRK